MSAVAQLKALLGMDNKQFKAGMSDSTRSTNSFKSSIASAGRTMAAAFSAGAILAATKSLIGFASEMRHTADNLKLSAESLQALNSVALKYGLSVEGLNKGLGKLRDSQGQAAAGLATYKRALVALGISQDEFTNANTAEALEMISRGYVDAGGDAEAFSAVTLLMGRSAKQATAFMEELADKGLKRIKEEAIAAGNVIEDELITKLELLGTKNEQIMLKMKVGFAQLLGRIGTGAGQIGTIFGSIYEQWERAGGGSSLSGNIKAAISTLRGGGIGEAVTAAGRNLRESDAKNPASKAAKVREARSEESEIQDAHVKAFEEAIQKRLKAEESLQAKIRAIRDRHQSKISALDNRDMNIQGQGIQTDSLARVGGFVGPQRGGLGIADRQLKIQLELKNRAEERNKLLTEMNIKLDAVEQNTSPAGVP